MPTWAWPVGALAIAFFFCCGLLPLMGTLSGNPSAYNLEDVDGVWQLLGIILAIALVVVGVVYAALQLDRWRHHR